MYDRHSTQRPCLVLSRIHHRFSVCSPKMDVKDTDLKKLLVSVAWLLVSKAPRSRAEKKKKCVWSFTELKRPKGKKERLCLWSTDKTSSGLMPVSLALTLLSCALSFFHFFSFYVLSCFLFRSMFFFIASSSFLLSASFYILFCWSSRFLCPSPIISPSSETQPQHYCSLCTPPPLWHAGLPMVLRTGTCRWLYVYIYIYVCVCVCACVYIEERDSM